MHARQIRQPDGTYEEYVMVLLRGDEVTKAGDILNWQIILDEDVCELSENINDNQFITAYITKNQYNDELLKRMSLD